jgi:malonyl CoA-acyl carrier protein transacylase
MEFSASLDNKGFTMKYALIFPGQGSQSLGMLSDLADNFSVVEDTFEEASDTMCHLCLYEH